MDDIHIDLCTLVLITPLPHDRAVPRKAVDIRRGFDRRQSHSPDVGGTHDSLADAVHAMVQVVA